MNRIQMNKKEICWLLVRFIGLCLLFNGVRYTVVLIESLLVISSGPAGPMLASQSGGLMKLWCGEAIASFIAAAYFIKRGHLVFGWLHAEPPN